MAGAENIAQNIRSQVTVVIPTLNAAASLAGCMAAVAGAVVIVVDGGSRDDTVAVAQALGARTILHCGGGRGGQLRAGVAVADTEFLLLLHADTVLAPGWDAAPPPDAAWYFTLRLDSRNPAARLVEGWAAWRSRIFGLPYGDQGLLLGRKLLAQVGGVPDLPLMEDVALARRLGRGRLRRHAAVAMTSAVRYERDGFLRRGAKNLFCLTLYFFGVSNGRIRKIYG